MMMKDFIELGIAILIWVAVVELASLSLILGWVFCRLKIAKKTLTKFKGILYAVRNGTTNDKM